MPYSKEQFRQITKLSRRRYDALVGKAFPPPRKVQGYAWPQHTAADVAAYRAWEQGAGKRSSRRERAGEAIRAGQRLLEAVG